MQSKIPLISPLHCTEFTAGDYAEYVKSLYLDPNRNKPKPKVVNVTRNKKGSVVFRIKRNPKFLSEQEFSEIAKQLDIPEDEFFILCQDRKIKIYSEEQLKSIVEIL